MFPKRPLCDPHQELVHSKWDLWTWKLENHWTYALNNPTTNISIRTHIKDIRKFQYECDNCKVETSLMSLIFSFGFMASTCHQHTATLAFRFRPIDLTWWEIRPIPLKTKAVFSGTHNPVDICVWTQNVFTPKLSSLGVWWNQFSMDKHVN